MIEIKSELLNTEEKAAEYVRGCEEFFEKHLSDILGRTLSISDLKIITLSGPSCSGKTTAARKLTAEIEKQGRRAKVLSIDDFYRDALRFEENPDLESAAAIDLALFADCAGSLLRGEKTLFPVFDLATGVRSGSAEYIPSAEDIYIFEGIQAVYPEITCHLRAFDYTSVFINVTEDVMVDGILFDKNEIRLVRRIVRDRLFRNSTAEFTLSLWNSVRENEEKNIFPNALHLDCFINSFLPYELFLMRDKTIALLETVPEDSPYSEEAGKLKDKMLLLPKCPVREDMIPKNSLFREFIG